MNQENIKIGEALAEKKKMQVRLAKCNGLLKKSYYYKGKPDFDYGKLSEEIISLTANIRELKLRIINTNISTNVIYNEKDMSLAEIIIRLGDIRSQIAVLSELYKPTIDDFYSLRHTEGDEIKPQVPPDDVEKEISRLNQEKTEIDALLQHTNWTKFLI